MSQKASQLQRAQPTLFKYVYSKRYLPPPTLQLTGYPLDVYALRNRAIFEARRQEGLWYFSKAVSAISPKRLPRSYAYRRLSRAFQEALWDHGYDKTGLVRDRSQTVHELEILSRPLSDSPEPIDLAGTLTLLALKPTLTAEYGNLKIEAGSLVRYLMRVQWLQRLESYQDDKVRGDTHRVKVRPRGSMPHDAKASKHTYSMDLSTPLGQPKSTFRT